LDLKIPYEQACEWVKESVKPLGEEYTKNLGQAFSSRWIDVLETKGKRSGAYSSGCYDTNPYVLLNYHENLNGAFTLAHELGHRVLHRDIFGAMEFDSTEDWKLQITQFPEREYGFLEYQANMFANCLLVPSDELDQRFDQAVEQIKAAGLNPADYPDECLDSICTALGKQFEVSRNVIQNRLTNKREAFDSRLR
jgi:Zn-dependent peptidase ImmA (M78 family)